jgi:hypothetical protein
MKPSIALKKIWYDSDVVEFEITTSDGSSQFCVMVYMGHENLKLLIAELNDFKDKLYGGIYDMKFGEFGPEYANGAFRARLHFLTDGRGVLFINVSTESDWHPFGNKEVASQATLYLKSDPALLDRFISELRRVSSGTQDMATLECV